MNIAIVGNGNMLLQCLDIILSNRSATIVCVITDPAQLDVNLVRSYCDEKAICLITSNKYDTLEVREKLSAQQVDYIFNINSRQLFSKEFLQIAVRGVVNFHNSYLPKYRGINVCSWAILNGEQEYGVTWHFISPDNIDGGEILIQQKFQLSERETAFTLILKCVKHGIELFRDIFPQIIADSYITKCQDLSAGSFFLRNQCPNGGRINFDQQYHKIDAFIRALNFGMLKNDFVDAHINLGGSRINVLKISKSTVSELDLTPGLIIELTDEYIVIACRDSLLRLEKFRLDGGSVSAGQIADKFSLKLGDIL